MPDQIKGKEYAKMPPKFILPFILVFKQPVLFLMTRNKIKIINKEPRILLAIRDNSTDINPTPQK